MNLATCLKSIKPDCVGLNQDNMSQYIDGNSRSSCLGQQELDVFLVLAYES
jgi:hypothetical protein